MSSARSGVSTAVILVGGEGSRLRPLTLRTPKPLLPLLGKPVLGHILAYLESQGVDRAILACSYGAEEVEAWITSSSLELTAECRVEPHRLGTGGAIRYAADGVSSTFLALNGDSLRDTDLDPLLRHHRRTGAMATILLTEVADASRYGLARLDARGRVVEFREKLAGHQAQGGLVNSGLYLLEPDVLGMISSGCAVSLESEVFPALAEEGSLYGLALPGYWLDIGTPQSYLEAHFDLLARRGVEIDPSARVSADAELIAPVVIGSGAVVHSDARVGPSVYVGAQAAVGRGAKLRRTVLLPGVEVSPGEDLADAIVAPAGVVDGQHGIALID